MSGRLSIALAVVAYALPERVIYYVPTGFVGYNRKTRAVKGHPFGLALGADDKRALIAFLKTL